MKYIVFGAGNNSEIIIKMLMDNSYEVCTIVDNDSSKWGKKILGIEIKPVESLREIDTHINKIIISVADITANEMIKKQLSELGFLENRDFYNGFELLMKNSQVPGRVSGYIPLEKKYNAIKTFDPASRLIKKKDEKRIFRVVSPGYESSYMEVYELCKKNALFGNEIINTTIVEEKYVNDSLVFEHEYVEPISYCFEWAPLMIFDYVNFMIDLMHKLSDAGLGLSDGHVLNATIHNGQFVFLDFGAIKTGYTRKVTLMEIINTHILPLVLLGRRQIEKAYMHLKNPGIEFTVADIQGYIDNYELQKMKELYDIAIISNSKQDIGVFCTKAKEIISYFKNDFSQTKWLGYQDDEWKLSAERSKWSTKMENAIALIESVKPKTIIDMAGNMGWYGSYLHDKLDYSIILDFDYGCVDNIWNRCKEEKINNVLPIYMSICSPTLDYYRDEPIGKSGIISWRSSAVDRMKADLVIALAIVHHLAFRQQLTFEEIIGQFELFSNRYLLIEFIQQEDQYITNFIKEGFEWYTEDNFVAELKKKFTILDTAKSTPSETRTIYLCEKIDSYGE